MSKYEKRLSPAVSAQDYHNKIKVGNDGNEYVSRANKKMVFKWYKIKDMNECSSAEKYYMQFPQNYLQKNFYKYDLKQIEYKLNIAKKELEKENIYLIKIGWKRVYNFIDYAWENAETYIKNKYFKENKKINRYDILDKANFIFYTESTEFWSQNDGMFKMQWSLNKNGKKIAFEILRKIFKNKFIEPKNRGKAIIIKLNKNI
jgi:hypothetical protein